MRGRYMILSWYVSNMFSWSCLTMLCCTALHLARQCKTLWVGYWLPWYETCLITWLTTCRSMFAKTPPWLVHCPTFAISDLDNASFRGEWDHLHNDTWEWCAFLHSAIVEVESALAVEMENLTDNEKEELSFKVTQATGNILAWKAHILRSIHQDRAPVELLDMLDETSVLLVQDWAMKYLPRKYCESQTDWFGERIIPWYISVAFRKRDEQIEPLAFCLIFKCCTQDSSVVPAVMANVIEQLKFTMLRMDTVFFWQDNAGCYHCGASIVCPSIIGR